MAVPLWALSWAGLLPSAAGEPLAYHAHEMVMGYGLGVVGGFLFTKVDRRALILSFTVWLAARLLGLMAVPPSLATAALALAFPLCVFAFAGWPFLRAARTAHNMVFGPLLGAFTLAELLYQLGALGMVEDGQRRGIMLAVGLLALLMLVMGGRVIPASTAGVVRDKGGFLPQRVQPWLEWTGIGGLLIATIADVAMTLPLVAGIGSAVAGVSALIRLARWKTHWTLDVPAMWSLHLGYVWLSFGLLAKGAAQALGWLPAADALHGITVGALGTLSLAMMMRTVLQRRGLAVRFSPTATAAIVAVSVAAALRLALPFTDAPGEITVLAGMVWSTAMLLAFAAMAAAVRQSRRAD